MIKNCYLLHTPAKFNIAQHFSNAAKTYDSHAMLHTKIAEKLLTFLPAKEYQYILEIGCGTGILTKKTLDLVPCKQLTAMDVSANMLEIAKNKIRLYSNVELIAADFLQLQSKTTNETSKFDLIISSSAIHWMQPMKSAISLALQYLKPNGKFLFSLMIDGTLQELHHSLSQTVPHKYSVIALPKYEEVLSILNTAPCKIENIKHESLPQFYPNALMFIKSLRAQGVNITGKKTVLTKQELKKLLTYYDNHYRTNDINVIATYEIMYCLAEKNAS